MCTTQVEDEYHVVSISSSTWLGSKQCHGISTLTNRENEPSYPHISSFGIALEVMARTVCEM